MMIRCKTCGKNIIYDIALQKLHCSQCGSNFDPKEFSDDSPTFDACSYTCQSCGAKLITTEDTEATAFCSYCGSTSILTGKMEKIKKPDEVLPFRITREQCREIYLEQAKNAFMVPGWLKSDRCVNSFRAIYMPYWSYKITASGHVKENSTSTERDGDYIVSTTSHYASEDTTKDIAVWSHDASTAFDDYISEMMDFNNVGEKEFRPFHEGYLSGFYADLADDTAKNHKRIAKEEVKARLEGSGRRFIGDLDVNEHKLKYMPVWFMSTRNKDRVTYAAINGYNGKIIADFPVSTRGFLLTALIAAAVLAAILSFVLVLRPEPAFWFSAILALIGLIYCAKEENRLRNFIMETGLSRRGIYLPSGGALASIFLCAFAGLLILTRNNLVIYGVVLFYALILSYFCIRIFRVHQQISFRRPPQFNRKGAAYDA